MTRLADIYSRYSAPAGFGDKGTAHNYMPIYDAEINRTSNTTLLEIGVLFGHSIAMWNEYLSPDRVVGLDTNLSRVRYPLDNVHECDATERDAVDRVLGERTFDYVIDDGSHVLADQIAAIDIFVSRLKTDGRMFIEDIDGDESLQMIIDHLRDQRLRFGVYDGRKPGRQPDEILIIIKAGE